MLILVSIMHSMHAGLFFFPLVKMFIRGDYVVDRFVFKLFNSVVEAAFVHVCV